MEQGSLPITAPLRVLLVEDDVRMSDLIREHMQREGMEVDAAYDGENGLARARSGDYAIVLLDVMLPGIGGFDVLRHLRTSPGPVSRLPVIMLTARGDEVDKILGLELGADDYLPKPFSSRELVARMRAVLRRTSGDASNTVAPSPQNDDEVLRVGDIEMDSGAREVRRGGESIELTGAEFDMLQELLRSAGEIVPREAISKAALGRVLMPYDRSIDVHMSNLRRKIGLNPRGGERIKSVRGVGYIYVKTKDSG